MTCCTHEGFRGHIQHQTLIPLVAATLVVYSFTINVGKERKFTEQCTRFPLVQQLFIQVEDCLSVTLLVSRVTWVFNGEELCCVFSSAAGQFSPHCDGLSIISLLFTSPSGHS